jgi:hypothetical protein
MRNVFVKTFRTAQITEVFRQPPLGGIRTAAAAVGETLRIIGTNLSGDNTRVTLGGVSQAVAPPVDDEQIDAVVPGTLPSGTHPVMIHHDLDFGTSTEPHEGFSSNVAAFVLIPTITNVVPPPSPGAAGGSTITVTLDPPVRPGQRISLLLGDDSVDANPLPPTPPTSATVQFVLPEAAGTHLMRVRVDGAESRLTFDPATSTFTGPTYTVT